MPSHIVVNNLGLTYKSTVGLSTATLPDVCKTPSPAGPIPIPYPNVADQSSLDKGTKSVKAKGNMVAIKGSEYSMSMGDEPGTVGGVTSNTFKKETSWITYSFDVKMEGKNVCRHTDKKFHNHKNTVDLAGNMDPCPPASTVEHDIKCAIQQCDKKNAKGQDYDISTTKAGSPMPPRAACSVLGTLKHTCVKETLEKKYPPNGKVQCEKTFDMRANPPPLASAQPPAGCGRRPDVIVGDPTKMPRNVDVYDAKFPCGSAVKGGARTGAMPSKPVPAAQYVKPNAKEMRDYKSISGKGKVTPLTPEDCKNEPCGGG